MTRGQKRSLYQILAGLALFVLGLCLEYFTSGWLNGWPAAAAFVLAWAVAGYSVVLEAVENIGRGQIFDEKFLMAVATIGAFALQEWGEGAAVMLFFQVGELFESVAVHRSRQSISSLMDLRPDSATAWVDGVELEKDPEDVEQGDILIVKPGERVPIDGIILEGSAALDTSKITGESAPCEVSAGDNVLSGCVNLSGVLKIEAQSGYQQSTVAKILELVESAADQKAKSERLITRFAKYYTPTVVIAAVLLAILPPLLVSASWAVWIKRALTFLVISCPCALVISVPLSYFGGIGAASKLGIVLKGGTVMEQLAKAEIAVFDKTGTLTSGQFSVHAVYPEGISKEELLRLVAITETYSAHPVSKAIRAAAGTVEVHPDDTKEIAGCGILATVEGHQILAGNHRLMERFGVAYTPVDAVDTIVYVARDGIYCGAITVGDTIRATTKPALQELKKCGVKRTIMLTGDVEQTAKAVAEAVGLDEYWAKLLPQDKVAHMQQLLGQKRQGTVLFVGDGVNDAPVLSLADVGVAMGGVGSDAAVEAADVVILNDDISRLPKAIRISQKTNRIAIENIIFALGVKAVVLVLGAMGYAPMWLAIFADVGVAVLAILNALRTMRN